MAIYPNSYLLSTVSLNVRKKFNHPQWATFANFLSPQRSFFVCEFDTLVPDPSTLVPRHNNTGTLRIYVPDDISEWHITGDYREKDILGGFGASGGFWTSISSLFTCVFGASLMWVLAGKKPLSTFGLVHTDGAIARLRSKEGQNPMAEIVVPTDKDCINTVAFIRDRILELGPFEEAQRAAISPEQSHELSSI